MLFLHLVLLPFTLGLLSFVISLGTSTLYWHRSGWRIKGVLAMSSRCSDCGQETDCTYSCHDLHRATCE